MLLFFFWLFHSPQIISFLSMVPISCWLLLASLLLLHPSLPFGYKRVVSLLRSLIYSYLLTSDVSGNQQMRQCQACYLVHIRNWHCSVYMVHWCISTTTDGMKNFQLLTFLKVFMHTGYFMRSIECIWGKLIVIFDNQILSNRKFLDYVSCLCRQTTAPSSGGRRMLLLADHGKARPGLRRINGRRDDWLTSLHCRKIEGK